MPTYGLSKKSWLGVARELVSGSPIALPTVIAPTKAGFTNEKKYVYFNEELGTRDGNTNRRTTVKSAKGTFKGPWYNDTGVYFLLAFMGADTPSQPNAGSDPLVYSHALTLADVPPSLTLFRAVGDIACYQLAYSVVEKLSFTWQADGKVLEMDGSFQSQYGTPITFPARPTPSAIVPFAGYVPTIKVNGASTSDMSEMKLDLEQKVELWYGSAGNQTFTAAYFGERTAKIDFTARFDNTTLYNDYDNDTTGDLNVVFTGDLIQGIYNESLTFDFPIVGWDSMEHDVSKVNTELKGKGTAMPGVAVNSLFTATVVNAVASY